MSYAVALDIGTTNIQALLVNLSSKKKIDYLNVKNSQIFYADNVISRMDFAMRSKQSEEKLRDSLKADISLIISALLKRKNISIDKLEKVVSCGNAVMHHILLNLSLESLARAPFRPLHTGRISDTTLEALGIDLGRTEKKTPFLFLPNLGGFIGSDALCVIVDTKIHKTKSEALAIDLGTNGEIILGCQNKILVASTSAGPAFEGWHIKCGVYGSSIIDIMSEFLRDREVDKTGFMKRGLFKYNLGNRIIEVTQKDVRQFQLAKAAIASGVNILKEHCSNKKISKIFITGLFGVKINKSNARQIGLLPKDIGLDRIHIRQNSALNGLKELLFARSIEKVIDPIIKRIEHIELHKEPGFQDAFTSSLQF